MSVRRVYLAKYRPGTRQRAHFAIFIPDQDCDRTSVAQDFTQVRTIGTIIHVVGEPVMSGFTHDFKRNYTANESKNLKELVYLGTVSVANIFELPTKIFMNESTPRGRLEREAVQVTPPPKGQNVRAPVDGVNTKRCQEWTMEFLQRLVSQGLIQPEAIAQAQAHRDPPTFGIFGANAPAASYQRPAVGSSAAVGSEWVWDATHQRHRRWDGQKWVWRSG